MLKYRIAALSLTCILLLLTIFSTAAYFFTANTNVTTTYALGEWVPAKTSIAVVKDDKTYTTSQAVSHYQTPVGEQYSIDIDTAHPQFLSFEYQLKNVDPAKYFDTPPVTLYIGETPVLQISRITQLDHWETTMIDLSEYPISDGMHTISWQVDTTYDAQYLADFSVQNMTTTELFAKPGQELQLSADKPVEKFLVEYETQQTQEVQTVEIYPAELLSIPEQITPNTLEVYSIDLHGNIEETQTVPLTLSETQETNFEVQAAVRETSTQVSTVVSVPDFELPVSVQTDTGELSQTQWFSYLPVPQVYAESQEEQLFVVDNFSQDTNFIQLQFCDTVGYCSEEKSYEIQE